MTKLLKIPYSFIRPIYEKTNFHKAVISEIENHDLRKAYDHCRTITRVHAKTFYMATRFLPYHKQRSIFAIYGLCRYLDDLVDEAEDLMYQEEITREQIFERLENFKKNLTETYQGKNQSDPILVGFADTLNRFQISLDLPLLLLEGVKMDLVKDRYQNFDELYNYSYKVASVVGLMTSEVFGYEDEAALGYAVDLGIAMQLTNILRDVGEDLERNRIYLPLDELSQFGITESDLKSLKVTGKFTEFMQFQVKRTREYYNKAEIGISMLSKDSRLPVLLAKENYSRILEKIEANDYNVFDHRAYLNSTEKFSILPKVMYSLK